MRPIPKPLLIHEARAIKLETSDMWNSKQETFKGKLTNVRIEPYSELTVTKDNREVKVSAVLFFDCVVSKPSGFDFSDVDVIEALGNRYEIIAVDKLYDEKKLHHYEVSLCL